MSKRARSTLRILPFSGRIAWKRRSRPCFGRAAGAVALDDEELALRRVTLLAIGELARQIGDVERPLAPGQVARLARRLARCRRLDDLGDDLFGVGRVLLEPLRQFVGDDALDDRPDLGGNQLVLGLRRKFRVGHLGRQDAGQTLAHVLARQRDLFPFGDAAVVGIGIDGAGQGRAKARQMRSAITLRDVVCKAQHCLVVAIGPLHRDFEHDAPGLRRGRLLLAADHDRRRMQCLLRAVEIADEGFESALEMQRHGLRLDATQIAQHQCHAAVQKSELAQPVFQGGKVELRLAEGLRARQEGDLGAGGETFAARPRRPWWGRACLGERRLGHAVAEPNEPLRPTAIDAQIEPRGEAVDDRDADPVESARHLVRVLIEFPAGVQVGHDDLGGGHSLLVVDADRNAAAVVGDGARAIGVQRHGDGVAIPAERLVDRIVDDLIDHMVQAGAVVGVANIHTRPLAHRVQPAQDLDRLLVIDRILAIGAAVPTRRGRSIVRR